VSEERGGETPMKNLKGMELQMPGAKKIAWTDGKGDKEWS